jgi:hypothetical protein
MLDQKDVDLALLNYCNSPYSATKVSPAMALMGRRMQTRMPTLAKQVMLTLPDHEALRQADKSAKQCLKTDFDRHHGARLLKPLPPGQPVLLRLDTDKDWCKTGTVIRAGRTGKPNVPGPNPIWHSALKLQASTRHACPATASGESS